MADSYFRFGVEVALRRIINLNDRKTIKKRGIILRAGKDWLILNCGARSGQGGETFRQLFP